VRAARPAHVAALRPARSRHCEHSAELRQRTQWVCWRAIPSKKHGNKPGKQPINAKTGVSASSTDPATWASFEDCLTALQKNKDLTGLGYVFSSDDPFVGIDLDNCRSSLGTLAPWAAKIIDDMNSYTDLSPGTSGAKIFVQGSLANLDGRKRGDFEWYDGGRFFTVTGIPLLDTSIAEATTAQLGALHRQFWPEHYEAATKPAAVSGSTDDSLFDILTRARNDDKFNRLWKGDTSGYPSPSEADEALCFKLAFYTGRDAFQMDAAFRDSRLMRDKWDEQRGSRGTYGEITITHAIKKCRDVHHDFRQKLGVDLDYSLQFIDFATLGDGPPPARRWIVHEWLPRGSLTTLFGRGGHGKSLVGQQLATSVANGQPWLGLETTQGPVLGLFCEDDDDELRRRQYDIFTAALIDPKQGAQQLHLDGRPGRFNTLVSFGLDRIATPTVLMTEIHTQCEALRPVLLILDNIAQMYAGTENDRSQVTQFCNELTGIARRFDCAVLLLGHTAKGEGSEYSGSTAWDAAVRSRLFLERQEDGTSLLKKVKANYSALEGLRLSYASGQFCLLPPGSGASSEVMDEAKATVRDAITTLTARQISSSHISSSRNYLIRIMDEGNMLNEVTEKNAHAALMALIDAGEVEPNKELSWRDKSRHAVTGLVLIK
jgi:putative DNA primase/helicase